MAERVLIVDDDPVARRLVENMVSRAGYEPVTAEGGDLALAILTGGKSRIDCVILDLVMPDLDGLGVLARMREAGLDAPVIVQTAHGGIDNVVSAMRAGASTSSSSRWAPSTSSFAAQRARDPRARGRAQPHQAQPFQHPHVPDIVTHSARMLSVLRTAERRRPPRSRC
jgi:DNA-binding NtrC family response regulator